MPNIAAPGNWNQTLSQVIIDPGGSPTNLYFPLSEFWTGTEYNFLRGSGGPEYYPPEGGEVGGVYPAKIKFVASGLLDVPDLYLDMTAAVPGDSPAVTFFGADGEVLDGGLYVSDKYDDRVALGDGRYIYHIMRDAGWDPESGTIWEQTGFTGVKSMLITGVGDYPQGAPAIFYGIYGSLESSDTPFWTDFTGGYNNRGISTRNRITELF